MKCPGQDTRYWRFDDIFTVACRECGEQVEFFKDDSVRRCKNCDTLNPNPRLDLGCAEHCKYAAECLKEIAQSTGDKQGLLKNVLDKEMRICLGGNREALKKADILIDAVERLLAKEAADPAPVYCVAYLYPVAADTCDKAGELPGEFAEKYRGLLLQWGYSAEIIDDVLQCINCLLIGGSCGSQAYCILHDALLLCGLQSGAAVGGFLTEASRLLAEAEVPHS